MRRLGWFALALACAFWCCGMERPVTSSGGDPEAAALLSTVIEGVDGSTDPAHTVPARWESVMGYLPVVITGPHGTPILAKPTGDCSSFTGATQWDFTRTCMEHDLAYDVIRYAGRIGDPLPASARQSADDMFDRDLHARCDQLRVSGWNGFGCHVFAEGFAQGVRLNSWRQGYTPPEAESPLRWLAMTLLTLELLAIGLVVRLWRSDPLRVHASTTSRRIPAGSASEPAPVG